VRIRNCIFRRNESEDYGGGIFSDEGNGYIVIEDSQFIGNRANDNSGGGIYIDRGNLKIKNCTFDGNYAREKGGGIFVEDDDGAVIRECTFINNSADKHGGAFYADDDDIHFINCVIRNNKAGENGGGVYLDHDADINFQGVMKVYDNMGSGNRKDDVYFDPESRVHSGGLLDGSNIGVRSRKSFKILENITQYEYDKFFNSNTGSLSKKIRSTTDETFLASVFANKSIGIIAGIILLAIISAIAGVAAERKRKQKIRIH
ncbi:MAG: right-handed parallel beta-helix repeat-containing protein, partial [Eubacterium sp.]|nr:right-handed parallel beta-helix repeat-containing protein [Eubacterium sp.]